MEENNQSSKSFVSPMIISLVMLIVILVTPAFIHTRNFFELKSLTWVIRIEQDEPLRFFLALDQLIFLNSFIKYFFFLMIYRFYSNKTSLTRTLLVGVFIEIYIFVSLNSGNLLYTIFPVSGIHPLPPADFPLPISILIFLILAKLIPPLKLDQVTSSDDWLVTDDSSQ
jgi:hypothetical protein